MALPIGVLIVDDHHLVRQGVRMVLDAEPDITVLGEATTGAEAMSLLEHLTPDVVVMDISLPDMSGIEVTRHVRTHYPQVRVVGLTIHEEEPYVLGMLRAGADGYIVKRTAAPDLVRAIHTVHAGGAVLDPMIARNVIAGYTSRAPETPESGLEPLTQREREVVILVAEGLTNAQIAARLGITAKTVQTHRSRIMEKLGVHDRTDLVRYGIRRGWVVP